MPGTSPPRLIALDWGTSSLRAWLLGDDGRILAVRRREFGVLGVTGDDPGSPARDYEIAFDLACGNWLDANPDLPAIACGMVGSAQGWREACYLTIPTDLDIGAADLTVVPHSRGVVHLVPGLRVASATGRAVAGDVMRGEETQIIGVLGLLPPTEHPVTIVLPGTHSKWTRVEDHKIASFVTSMTGEVYGLMMKHSILGRTAAAGIRDDAAFERGLAAGGSLPSHGLLAELFGARVLVLDGLLDPASVPDYVSGVIIGDEIRHLLPEYAPDNRILLCGNTDLCRRYAQGLRPHGVVTETVAEEAAAAGLWHVAVTAGLVRPTPGAIPGKGTP
ncbi:2-keto-3-deoxy-galactonokinase [Rhodococcus sp. WMMA185]|uniref:2-dehydro-3-deoxygalactonokinase n=1 Tax=Rhodococcus sp. WMMA185 TaxID=679318 RepID=UPI0008789084|nr:2-dehydro-3-deoxygalactonokinase [Rhodococcus sp. WMMA185]AOW93012.1 2-keto-3-deoxy-galactonokinase [Rhodococcus sp. WMMA185]